MNNFTKSTISVNRKHQQISGISKLIVVVIQEYEKYQLISSVIKLVVMVNQYLNDND